MWVGPYSIEIDYSITAGFDILGYVPGTEIINVPFTKQLEDKYCSYILVIFQNKKLHYRGRRYF